MPDQTASFDMPWEIYVVLHYNRTAHGNVYLDTDLIYRVAFTAEDAGRGEEDDFTMEHARSYTQARFAHSLWSVLIEAQPEDERKDVWP